MDPEQCIGLLRERPHAAALRIVPAVLGTRGVRLVVDTGSARHVIAKSVADGSGLEVDTDVAPTAIVSPSNKVRSSVGELPARTIQVQGGFRVSGQAALVVELPPTWKHHGFLSPQQLATQQRVVVLDLPGDRLLVLPYRQAAAWLPDQTRFPSGAQHGFWLGSDPIPVCSSDGNRVFRINAEHGRAVMKLLLDTGMRTTSVATRRLHGGASAGPLVVGDFRANDFTAVDEFVTSASCPTDGVLGMDVLKDCVFVFSGERGQNVQVRCWNPG